jgi:repressor LexA
MNQSLWQDVLRRRRRALGKSQQDVANSSGGMLNQTEVSRLERGLIHPTTSLALSKFVALLAALEWTQETFEHQTGLALPLEPNHLKALQQSRRLEVKPEWLTYPVYASVSAGNQEAEPIDQQLAYIPRDKLKAKGVDPRNVRVYYVNGDCMISNEAQRAQKNIAPGDHVAVDTARRPQSGDVVVAWWPKEEKMVVKRFKIENQDIVLYPINPAHPNLVLASEDEVFILGTVIWRGG